MLTSDYEILVDRGNYLPTATSIAGRSNAIVSAVGPMPVYHCGGVGELTRLKSLASKAEEILRRPSGCLRHRTHSASVSQIGVVRLARTSIKHDC